MSSRSQAHSPDPNNNNNNNPTGSYAVSVSSSRSFDLPVPSPDSSSPFSLEANKGLLSTQNNIREALEIRENEVRRIRGLWLDMMDELGTQSRKISELEAALRVPLNTRQMVVAQLRSDIQELKEELKKLTSKLDSAQIVCHEVEGTMQGENRQQLCTVEELQSAIYGQNWHADKLAKELLVEKEEVQRLEEEVRMIEEERAKMLGEVEMRTEELRKMVEMSTTVTRNVV